MAWYTEKGNNNDIVISTRARLARNISGIPFPSKLTPDKSKEVIGKVFAAMEPVKNDFSFIKVNELSAVKQQALLEKHLISPALTGTSFPRGVMINSDETLSVMINEEDHIRIQSLYPGLEVQKAFDDACRIDRLLEETLNFAYHAKYGYLTSCPTNTGTGLRISVMLHLPALSISGGINNLLSQVAKNGFTVRGMFGEGSDAAGNFYQLSNQITLGVSEEEIISKFQSITSSVIEAEQTLRKKYKEDLSPALADKLLRSYGLLKYCRLLSAKEMINLINDVRFGMYLGIIPSVPFEKITQTMITASPANIMGSAQDMSPALRDEVRARAVNAVFSDK